MKVLLIGIRKKYGSTNFIYKSLTNLGVDIRLVNQKDYFNFSLINKIGHHIGKTPHYFFTGKFNRKLVSVAQEFNPDLILCIKPIIIKPKTVRKLSEIARVFSWYPDYVLFPKTCSTDFYKSIPLYDCHFSFNLANAEEMKKLGAKKSVFLPCAADISCHKLVKVSEVEKERLGADIVFIGTYANEKRAEYLERLCEEGYDVKIYGNDWDNHPKSSCLYKKGCIQNKAFYCEDMSKILNSSKIALSFVRGHNDETLACRSFEIPACGAFMLHERTSKIGEYFKEGEEAVFFDSYKDLKEKIDFYLRKDDLRKKIAERGRQRVIEGGNLFINRVQEIIDIYRSMN